MTDFQKFNAATHPIIKLDDDWGNLLDHGLVKSASYVIRNNAGTYEAIDGNMGKIVSSGANASIVIQAAINNFDQFEIHTDNTGTFDLQWMAIVGVPLGGGWAIW